MKQIQARGKSPMDASWSVDFAGLIEQISESSKGGAILCLLKGTKRSKVLNAYELAQACTSAKMGLIDSKPTGEEGEMTYTFDAEKIEGLQLAVKAGKITIQ